MAAIADIAAKAMLQQPQFHALMVTLLTIIKNISMEPSTLEQLAQCMAFQTLVPVLNSENGNYDKDMESQVIQCMFYLCRISRKRQERAATAGLVPHLQRCINEDSQVQQFALEIICDLAHTSAPVRDILWQHDCVEFYMSIISHARDKHWHVTALRSLSAWLLNDTERVESRLVAPNALAQVISLFCTAQQADFEKVVEELHTMMQKSMLLVKAFGVSEVFVQEVKARLHYPKAMVGKTLLAMLRLIYRNHPKPRELDRRFNLYPTVVKLARNNAQVLVAEMATLLLQDIDELGGKYGV
ncbi:hypothetical protein JKP88DRAFT_335585 [Tribonema minus]|uniref:Uncharacterized protein n=1 Tax=Tribonema minus TaxID=303371 RepID=A0A836C999_9STRA|nr:hypothetical protein JKP88DRAFT_335585 [Tribonema minus]